MILAKRAVVRRSDTATIRTWVARDIPGAVAEVVSLYGHRRYYLAILKVGNGNEKILSRHRQRGAAIRSLAERLET